MRGSQSSGGKPGDLAGGANLVEPDVADVIGRMRALEGVTTDVDLAVRMGIARSAPSAWRARKRISLEVCLEFAAAKGVPLDWLLFGVGPSSRTDAGNFPIVAGAPVPTGHIAVGRLYGFDTTSGPDSLIFPELVIRQRAPVTPALDLRWMVNPTDALAPRLPKGGILLIDGSVTQHDQVADGDTYVVRMWGRVNVRRIFIIGPNEYRLRGDSEVEERRDLTGPDYQHLEIGGRVIDAI
jgi:Predicted transcriptional regulator